MCSSLVLLALAAATPAGPVEPDPFAAPARDPIAAMVRAAQFGDTGADAAMIDWLVSHPDAPKTDRMRLEHRLCGDYTVKGANASAARACAAATALGADDAEAAANSAKLRDVPPIHVTGTTRVPLTANGLGSRDADVTVNDVTVPWIMDTGAQITVVTQSLAQRIGVHMLGGKAEVGSTTGAVQGGLGVIDQLRIGTASVEHVPVLVLPDAQLKIGDLPQIQGILGLPVFVAFRRAAWLDGGATLALGALAPTAGPGSARLYWHEEGIGVPVSTPIGTRGAHLDTGANATYLRAPAHALLDRATEASGTVHAGKLGGAGGVIDTKQTVYPSVALAVAGVPMTLTKVSIDEAGQEGAARLGDDVVRGLSLLALDFEHMKVTATALRPLAPRRASP